MTTLSPKDPAEIIDLAFDFSALASMLSAPVVTSAVHSGVSDANPAAILSGTAQVDGTQVVQRVTGGTLGSNYLLRCQVDAADGQRYVLAAVLPVRAA